MKLKEILTPSFRDFRRPSVPVVTVSDDSDFCSETVGRGILTEGQMEHAARRYRLGRSRSGRTIFWMIDERGIVRDGHIGDSWASLMLKAREPALLRNWHASHCLFGMHLLGMEGPVAIVESERTAVIMSELCPQCLWMAPGLLSDLTPDSLLPLGRHRITLFPPVDTAMDSYLFWREVAEESRRRFRLDVTVSTVLEDHATQEQREQCIGILGFVLAGQAHDRPP
jgi:hypothetical protein